jgi:hypothetical protein
VKGLVRLAFFLSFCFVVIFPVAAAIRYLRLWIDAARVIPAETLEVLPSLISAGQWALPVVVYASILLTLSYSARKAFPIPMSILCVFVLSGSFAAGISLGLLHANAAIAAPGTAAPPALGGPGLILTQGETAVVLLDEPSNPGGARVTALPGSPLIYQESPARSAGPVDPAFTLPPIPFRIGEPDFVTSLVTDFSLAAERLQDRLGEGFLPFGIYLGALCLLLSSLRFVLELSSWPLANIFLGVLVFRGILAAETFLESGEIQRFIGSLLKADVPRGIITPGILCGMAVLVILYTALSNLARRRKTAR